MEKVFCEQCGKECIPDGVGTGYGVKYKTKRKICYACCGINDYKRLENMKIGDKAVYYLNVYLSEKKGEQACVSNWCGTMKFPIHYVRKGFHNLAYVRRDVWFSYKGNKFHGTQYGNLSELCYIKRIKG